MQARKLVLSNVVDYCVLDIEVPGDILDIYEEYGVIYLLYEVSEESSESELQKYKVAIVPANYTFAEDWAITYYLTNFVYGESRYFCYYGCPTD